MIRGLNTPETTPPSIPTNPATAPADLIVADLTDHNPNVHYELGVAHSLRKHVIPMIVKGQTLPFDNMPVRTIFYSRDHPRDQAIAVGALRSAADAELAGEVQNPVTHALGTLELSKGDDKDKVIATLSTQIADHAAELSQLRDLAGAIVKVVVSNSPFQPSPVASGTNIPFVSGQSANALAWIKSPLLAGNPYLKTQSPPNAPTENPFAGLLDPQTTHDDGSKKKP
jgi:hypothetical protein